MAPLLAYWDSRGLVDPIRILLYHVGEEFEYKSYVVRVPQKYQHDRTEWHQEKAKLDVPFPNLPYYIDGNVKLTQSLAIMRYIARKHKLDGATEQEKQLIDVLEQETKDFRLNLKNFAVRPDYEKHKEEYLRNLRDKLRHFAAVLKDNKWFVGNRVTYVDFLIYDVLDCNLVLESTCLDNFPTLKSYVDRIETLPSVMKHLESSSYKRFPVLGPCNYWGFYKD